VSYSVNSSAPQGTVAYTSPSFEGTTGETVSIYVSTGYVPPPPPSNPPPSNPPPNKPPANNPPPNNPPGDNSGPGNGNGHKPGH
jgi:hypothetical protein